MHFLIFFQFFIYFIQIILFFKIRFISLFVRIFRRNVNFKKDKMFAMY